MSLFGTIVTEQGHLPLERSDVMELKIEYLKKQFKDKRAVDDACITLTPGVWGLLGAKGA